MPFFKNQRLPFPPTSRRARDPAVHSRPMETARIDATLATLTAEEIAVAYCVIDVFERWNMTKQEAGASS